MKIDWDIHFCPNVNKCMDAQNRTEQNGTNNLFSKISSFCPTWLTGATLYAMKYRFHKLFFSYPHISQGPYYVNLYHTLLFFNYPRIYQPCIHQYLYFPTSILTDLVSPTLEIAKPSIPHTWNQQSLNCLRLNTPNSCLTSLGFPNPWFS